MWYDMLGELLAGPATRCVRDWPMSKPDKLFTDGEAYERLMGRWSRLVAKAFLDWLNAPNNLTWLDVGCGNGAFTEELIARCAPAAVTAVDPSDDQLAYAVSTPSIVPLMPSST
jgi:SAM-dependent methyltransferase